MLQAPALYDCRTRGRGADARGPVPTRCRHAHPDPSSMCAQTQGVLAGAGGAALRPGQTCSASPLSISQLLTVSCCMQRFDPQRFLGEPVPTHAYLPFGFGPRVCPGERLALFEIRLLLAMALQVCLSFTVSLLLRLCVQKYSFKLACKPEDVRERLGIILWAENDIPLYATARV